MSKYEVSNAKSSHSFGIYEAESPDAAIEAACHDAGYANRAEAEEAMGRDSDLVAAEVPAITGSERATLIAYQSDAGSVGDMECVALIDRALAGDAAAVIEARRMLAEDPQSH